MKNKKAIFMTSCDIYDEYGNGGVQGARKNCSLIEEYFGKENVVKVTFPQIKDTKAPDNAVTFSRANSNIGKLIAAIMGCKLYYPWKEKGIINFIKKSKVDFLFLDYSHFGRLAHIEGKHKTVLFYGNVEADYAWNKVKNEGLQYLPSYFASKYNDKCGTKADKILCLNERDSKRIQKLYGRKADFILNVSFDDCFEENRTQKEYDREVLFLGSKFGPNEYSVEWFIREVMPYLNDIKLNIVGKGFEEKREEYEKNPNVKVIGTVRETAEYYYKHAVVVQPIKYGAGMKVKTAEAMMYGRTILASDEALEGYDVDGVKGIFRCNDAKDYIEILNKLFEGKELPSYQDEVRNLFCEKYSTQSLKRSFFEFMDDLFKE